MAEVVEHLIHGSDGVPITLHRILGPDGGGRTPVLLAAGTFSGRTFWLGSRGQGFAMALAAAGYDAWVLEQRGRGAVGRPRSWTMDDWIRHDAPAAVEHVARTTGSERLLWVGHSAGGVVGAAFAGSGSPLADHVRGLVLLGTPGPGGLRGRRRWGAWATLALAGAAPSVRWPGSALGLGPEREPARLIRDWMHWNLTGRWRGSTGVDYLAGLDRVRSPVLAVAGSGDHLLAPPVAVRDLLERFGSSDRTLIVAGREQGYSTDFDHPGLIIGSAARLEIWPRVLGWIESRASVITSESAEG